VVVLADPDLQLAGHAFAEFPATIEERLVDPSDLGDVEADGDGVATGQSDAEKSLGVLGE
jgi:hypothetical protein